MSGAEIAVALAAASAAVTAAGAIQQGEASRKMANYQAALAESNAVAARQQAELDERRHREKARQLRSAHRARFAKGGVLPEEGSPLLFDVELGEGTEIDALNIRRAGERDAASYRARADLSLYEGRVAQQRGYLSATGTLLQAPSQAVSAYRTGAQPAAGR
jgi:hypothetical protein